eukprot:7737995-Pyramimonas_sp.AAC.1
MEGSPWRAPHAWSDLPGPIGGYRMKEDRTRERERKQDNFRERERERLRNWNLSTTLLVTTFGIQGFQWTTTTRLRI